VPFITARLSAQRKDKEDEYIPKRVAYGDQDERTISGVKCPPVQAADQGGQDEHDVAIARMDGGVEGGGPEPAAERASRRIPMPLEKSPPEHLLAGSDQQDDQKGNSGNGSAVFKGINTADSFGSKREDRAGELVTRQKNKIQDQGRKAAGDNLFGPPLSKVLHEQWPIGFIRDEAKTRKNHDVGAHPPPEVEGTQVSKNKKGNKQSRGQKGKRNCGLQAESDFGQQELNPHCGGGKKPENEVVIRRGAVENYKIHRPAGSMPPPGASPE
jgi:hypothetical protein